MNAYRLGSKSLKKYICPESNNDTEHIYFKNIIVKSDDIPIIKYYKKFFNNEVSIENLDEASLYVCNGFKSS